MKCRRPFTPKVAGVPVFNIRISRRRAVLSFPNNLLQPFSEATRRVDVAKLRARGYAPGRRLAGHYGARVRTPSEQARAPVMDRQQPETRPTRAARRTKMVLVDRRSLLLAPAWKTPNGAPRNYQWEGEGTRKTQQDQELTKGRGDATFRL